MDFPYSFAQRALKKWREQQLKREPAADGTEHFMFTYQGSTCCNGGTPFTAILHALLSGCESTAGAVVERAWIEIPDYQKEAASRMCSSPGRTAAEAKPFFDVLAQNADFAGQNLETVILREVPENFAGCFCGRPHINQKWKAALSTVHFALRE
jgi:hypothetical protein